MNGPRQSDEPGTSGAATEASTTRDLPDVKRSFSRAILTIERLDEGEAVIKDFGPKSWLLRRVIGPFLLDREEKAYRLLCGIEGFPRWYRRPQRHALAVERVHGDVLGRDIARRFGTPLFERLAATVDRMHEAGVVHLDLHQKRNILIDDAGKPYLIDFASSFRFAGNWWLSRWLLRTLGRADRASVIKFKARYLPEFLTDEEQVRMRRARWLSWIWIFRPVNSIKKRIVRALRRPRDGGNGNHDATPPA